MATRRRRRSKSLAAQTFELGIAAPQVIAHRLARTADRAEMHRMGVEKIAAFQESWTAMATQAVLENQKFALRCMQALWFPWLRPAPTPKSVSRQLNRATLNVLGQGMAPVRRRAVANAKRLGRIKR
jgi:hypothetical protein